MTTQEPEPNSTSDHILDWLEDSVTFFPTFLDDPYHSNDINGLQWWDESHDLIHSNTTSTSLNNLTSIALPTTTRPPNPTNLNQQSPSDSSKKQKVSDDQHIDQKNHVRPISQAGQGDQLVEDIVVPVKRTNGNKKSTAKTTGNNCNNGNSKEGRWAEQLLNPCALAITCGNLTRVQHLLYVLHELASLTGDANHRLAAHGLRALTQHLSSSVPHGSASAPPVTFASTEPRFFQKSLLKFYEVSPWFAFPNNIANSSILQLIAEESDRTRNLHIVDVGVSHGMQWPTLLEALTRRPGGPPPLVKITVVSAAANTENNQNRENRETPFSIGPPGDNFSFRLLGFAKSMNINLQINRLDNQPLQNLNAQVIDTSNDELLIVCVQFRLHNLNHNTPDERTEFLKALRNMEPKGVILSENNMECSCNNCGDFATGFSRQVEYLWRFLDSTSSAFKGRESDERRVMEGEAAKALTNRGEMNEGKDKWCERMKGVGFVGQVFGEDAIDGGRALLRKYDNNWEMRMDEKDGCAGLWWKGQPVSFCSLWKTDVKVSNS
ncbi:PREDICTED: nodulation-signaling pathway 1 protein [Prunus mume]|uniref:Nodulation-signaling pathway 1 protein n=1 Tax=Prunus mume TaxID=102107 RepID=A0ABM0NQ92_PRUMU|nr:PREDICTED: nodulation-signaling pathway 1 protein [Prunus mume]